MDSSWQLRIIPTRLLTELALLLGAARQRMKKVETIYWTLPVSEVRRPARRARPDWQVSLLKDVAVRRTKERKERKRRRGTSMDGDAARVYEDRLVVKRFRQIFRLHLVRQGRTRRCVSQYHLAL
jgi:hypothetical protein